jgi:hypothetical protein
MMPTALPGSSEPIRSPNNGADQGLMHYDSALGMLWLGLGKEDRCLQVAGRPLGNLVYELAEGISLRQHDTTQALLQLRQIRAQLPGGQVARLVDAAINRLDAPDRPIPALPAEAPAPLHTLMAELGAINLVRRGGDYGTAQRWHETDKLADLVTQWLAGRLNPIRFERALRDLARQRHESQEGWIEIRDAVTRALSDCRSWIRRPRPAAATTTAAAEPVDELAPAYQPEPVGAAGVVTGEVTGLEQSIAYAEHLAEHAGQHGPEGNEDYLARLVAHRITRAGLTSGRAMQDAFAAAAAAAAAHAAELTKQKTVQEAYDMHADAGDKDFQTGAASDGGDSTKAAASRHDVQREAVVSASRPSLVEQAAANRRALLGHLDELATVLTDGAAGEGITADELAQIHAAALRLAAAAKPAAAAAPERHPAERPEPRRGTDAGEGIRPAAARADAGRPQAVAQQLQALTERVRQRADHGVTDEQVDALFEGMSVAEIKQVAEATGMPATYLQRTRDDLIRYVRLNTVEGALTFRAIAGDRVALYHQPSQQAPSPAAVPGPHLISNSRGMQFEYDPGTGTAAVIEAGGWRNVVAADSSTGIAAWLLYENQETKDGRGDVGADAAARARLDRLSADELHEVADETGTSLHGARTKARMIDTIINLMISGPRKHRGLRAG